MLLLQLVNRAENCVALDFPKRVGILEADLQLVSLADFVGNKIAGSKLRRAESVVDGIQQWLLFARLSSFSNVILGYAERQIQVNTIRKTADFPFTQVQF